MIMVMDDRFKGYKFTKYINDKGKLVTTAYQMNDKMEWEVAFTKEDDV